MENKKSVLFGIDDSDFARQTLSVVGGLEKPCSDLKMTLFHGASAPDFSLLSKWTGKGSGAAEEHEKLWFSEAEKVLERAKDTLRESGFDPERMSAVFEKNCADPAGAMLNLARAQGIETIAVSRWGKRSVSRQIIGSVTYRLTQLADDRTLWVIDPRIRCCNVLIGLVGAPISRRIVDHAVRYFSHLKESRFTLFHVVPPVPPQCFCAGGPLDVAGDEGHKKLTGWLREYTDSVKAATNEARKTITSAGVPEKNVVFKLQPQKSGIARDILVELEEGDHGILVIGRRGFKDIREFGLGSKANKLLINSRAFIVCLVS
jgi:nucleotide-binding universal stress UspA family protein